MERNEESLFSLEILIDKIESLQVHCALPTITFRFLDSPLNTIYQHDPRIIDEMKCKYSPTELASPDLPRGVEQRIRNTDGSYTINRGKSCLFKIKLIDLHQYLSNRPLCLMIVDVWPTTPKLIGSTLVSLHNCVNRIHTKVERQDSNIPVITGERGTFSICNLMGSTVGMMSLQYKLLSLGTSLLPHVPEGLSTQKDNQQSLCEVKVNQAVSSLTNTVTDSDDDKTANIYVRPSVQSIETQTELVTMKKMNVKKSLKTNLVSSNNDGFRSHAATNTFRPMPLYYNSLADENGMQLESYGDDCDKYFTNDAFESESNGSVTSHQCNEEVIDWSTAEKKSLAETNIGIQETLNDSEASSEDGIQQGTANQEVSLARNIIIKNKLKKFPVINSLFNEMVDLIREIDRTDDSIETIGTREVNKATIKKGAVNSRNGATLKFGSTKTQRLRLAKHRVSKQKDKVTNVRAIKTRKDLSDINVDTEATTQSKQKDKIVCQDANTETDVKAIKIRKDPLKMKVSTDATNHSQSNVAVEQLDSADTDSEDDVTSSAYAMTGNLFSPDPITLVTVGSNTALEKKPHPHEAKNEGINSHKDLDENQLPQSNLGFHSELMGTESGLLTQDDSVHGLTIDIHKLTKLRLGEYDNVIAEVSSSKDDIVSSISATSSSSYTQNMSSKQLDNLQNNERTNTEIPSLRDNSSSSRSHSNSSSRSLSISFKQDVQNQETRLNQQDEYSSDGNKSDGEYSHDFEDVSDGYSSDVSERRSQEDESAI